MSNTTDYNYMEAMTEDIKEYIKNEITLSDYSDRDKLEEFEFTENVLEKGAEWCDVTIRCYLLGQAIAEVLDDMEEELEETFTEVEEMEA